ncbi:MAG: 6-phosphogluconolactonase [Gammaproteobacteria bacterium]|nr:MAG: 6-phosphogluconolactonase [Gammaproteobacteria bacterium]
MKMPELPDNVNWVEADSRSALAARLAEDVAARLRSGLESRDRVSLAVSGGSTPVPFFEALSQQALPWSRVDVTLVDERWVGGQHEASNTRLVKNHLLVNEAAAARFVPLKTSELTPYDALDSVEAQLESLAWPLNVAVLGMGNDGHTASLFPGAAGLASALAPEGDARVAAMTPLDAPHDRITFTASALLRAGHRALHIVGEDKRMTLEKALENLEDVAQMPIRLFLQQPLTIYWCA